MSTKRVGGPEQKPPSKKEEIRVSTDKKAKQIPSMGGGLPAAISFISVLVNIIPFKWIGAFIETRQKNQKINEILNTMNKSLFTNLSKEKTEQYRSILKTFSYSELSELNKLISGKPFLEMTSQIDLYQKNLKINEILNKIKREDPEKTIHELEEYRSKLEEFSYSQLLEVNNLFSEKALIEIINYNEQNFSSRKEALIETKKVLLTIVNDNTIEAQIERLNALHSDNLSPAECENIKQELERSPIDLRIALGMFLYSIENYNSSIEKDIEISKRLKSVVDENYKELEKNFNDAPVIQRLTQQLYNKLQQLKK